MNQAPCKVTVTEKDGRWEIVISAASHDAVLTCATKTDADILADVGPLLDIHYCHGDACSTDRVRRCIAALHRNGYGETYLMTRQLNRLAERLATNE